MPCLFVRQYVYQLLRAYTATSVASPVLGRSIVRVLGFDSDQQTPSSWLCRSQWPRDLKRRSAAARLLRSWVRIPPGVWMSVCTECCVLSGRGLCDELTTRPDESYRLCCVVACYLETSEILAHWGLSCQNKLQVADYVGLSGRAI